MDGRNDPATPQQRRKIAQLNMALGNREPTEEYPMTIGQAGELIRRMVSEIEAQRRLKRLRT